MENTPNSRHLSAPRQTHVIYYSDSMNNFEYVQ